MNARVKLWQMMLIAAMIPLGALAGTLVDQGQSGTHPWLVSFTNDGGVTNNVTIGGGAVTVDGGIIGTVSVVGAVTSVTNTVPVAGAVTVDGGIIGTVSTVGTVNAVTSITNTVNARPVSNSFNWLSRNVGGSLGASGSACTTPGAGGCAVMFGGILGDDDWIVYKNISITLSNTGSNPISDVIVEWSADQSNYEAWDPSSFDELPANTTKSIQISGNSRQYLRVEGRSQLGTTFSIYVKGNDYTY